MYNLGKYIPLFDKAYKDYEPQELVPGTFEWALYMKIKFELDRPTLKEWMEKYVE